MRLQLFAIVLWASFHVVVNIVPTLPKNQLLQAFWIHSAHRSQRRKMSRNLLTLSLFLLLFIGVHADICKDYYHEFHLEEEYNKRLEPEEDITIEDRQTLHNIVEVGIKGLN